MACVCTSLEIPDDIVYHGYSSILPVLFRPGSYCSIHAVAVLVSNSQNWRILLGSQTMAMLQTLVLMLVVHN